MRDKRMTQASKVRRRTIGAASVLLASQGVTSSPSTSPFSPYGILAIRSPARGFCIPCWRGGLLRRCERSTQARSASDGTPSLALRACVAILLAGVIRALPARGLGPVHFQNCHHFFLRPPRPERPAFASRA